MALFDRNLGELFRADQVGIAPQEAPSGTIQGAYVDRMATRPSDGTKNQYDGLYVMCQTGAATGDAPAVTFTVQDASDASGTGAAPYIPPNSTVAAALTMSGKTGSNSAAGLSVDISGARRYINVAATVTESGSFTVGVAAGMVLTGAKYQPAS